MMGDYHVRFCEGLRVKLLGSTRQFLIQSAPPPAYMEHGKGKDTSFTMAHSCDNLVPFSGVFWNSSLKSQFIKNELVSCNPRACGAGSIFQVPVP